MSDADTMAEAFGALKAHYRSAHAKYLLLQGAQWALTWGVASTPAVGSNLEADAARIARLDPDGGELGAQVLGGELELERWLAIAQTTWDDITAQAKVMGEDFPSWDRVYGEVIAPTGRGIAAKVDDITDKSNVLLWVAAAVFGGLVFLRVT